MLIKLPFPDSRLNPNKKNGKHWASTNSVKVEAFKYAYYATLEAMAHENLKDRPLVLNLVFVQPDRRKRDLDNLLASAKSQIDGICKALGIDDHVFECVSLSRSYNKGKGALHAYVTEPL